MSGWYFSEAALSIAELPPRMRRHARDPHFYRGSPDEQFSVAIVCASDVLGGTWDPAPEWSGPDTRYLVFLDVPEAGTLRVVSRLQLHRPELRLHITRDVGAVRRLIVAQAREHPFEGIVDAYMLFDSLVLVLGDLSIREFPTRQVAPLAGLTSEALGGFEIDEDGSYLHWREADLHLGVSQLLQAVDPSYLADIEIRRLSRSMAIGDFVASVRTRTGLRQSDIPGLGERQVRRIEQGVSQLTAPAADKLAAAFQMSIGEFLAAASNAAARHAHDADEASEDPAAARKTTPRVAPRSRVRARPTSSAHHGTKRPAASE